MCKILTYINPFEQNNDHMRISHEIEFRSSFKVKSLAQLNVWCNVKNLVIVKLSVKHKAKQFKITPNLKSS